MSVSGDSDANNEVIEGGAEHEIQRGALRMLTMAQDSGRTCTINVYFTPNQVKEVDGVMYIHLETREYHVQRLLTNKVPFDGKRRGAFMRDVIKSTSIIEKIVEAKNAKRRAALLSGTSQKK